MKNRSILGSLITLAITALVIIGVNTKHKPSPSHTSNQYQALQGNLAISLGSIDVQEIQAAPLGCMSNVYFYAYASAPGCTNTFQIYGPASCTLNTWTPDGFHFYFSPCFTDAEPPCSTTYPIYQDTIYIECYATYCNPTYSVDFGYLHYENQTGGHDIDCTFPVKTSGMRYVFPSYSNCAVSMCTMELRNCRGGS